MYFSRKSRDRLCGKKEGRQTTGAERKKEGGEGKEKEKEKERKRQREKRIDSLTMIGHERKDRRQKKRERRVIR